jgi:hypothetical protein
MSGSQRAKLKLLAVVAMLGGVDPEPESAPTGGDCPTRPRVTAASPSSLSNFRQ